VDFKQKNNQICIDVKKCAKICTKNKKIWKYKYRLCYNEVSQKELFIQEEVRGWYHLPISSKINLEYMQGPDCFLCRKLTSNITIFKGTDSGDAKRMFCVMNLAVKQGDQITVHVEGENEEADAEVMREFLKNNL
jgi:phosphotransferase system HPr (HPr) family protein